MENHQILQKLKGVETRSAFGKLAAEMREWNHSDLFEGLFPVALDSKLDFSIYGVAADLLVKLDPECPLSCRAAIRSVVESSWDVSLRQIPFYVVTQFGKRTVLAEVEAILAEGTLTGNAEQSAVIFANWVRQPASMLASPYFCWRENWGQPESGPLGALSNSGPTQSSGNPYVGGGAPSVS